MYFIVGSVAASDLANLPSLDTFDSIYSSLQATCSFVPYYGKNFSEKLKFSLRQKIFTTRQTPLQGRLEIEETDKKAKVVPIDAPIHLFFGVYCSQSVHLANHREIKIKLA